MADVLNDRLTELGISDRKAAELCGLYKGDFAAVVKGSRASQNRTLRRVAKGLGIPLADLQARQASLRGVVPAESVAVVG